MTTKKLVKSMNPLLQYVNDLMAFFDSDTIKIPPKYRDRILAVKKLLVDDVSGLINTVIDFQITSALVNYQIETDNPNLTKVLNDWLSGINKDLIGKAPTGMEALAKEYFRERWKGSSNLLLRTFWTEESKNLELPTTLFFVDGEDIVMKHKPNETVILGEEKYGLLVNVKQRKIIDLPSKENELIFIQKPFESWGTLAPIPYVIRRGLFRNGRLMHMLEGKTEFIVGRALEYLMVIKKGTEKLALEGRAEFTYDEDDLKGVSEHLQTLLKQKKQSSTGTPTYTTNFDTEIEHLIPEYERGLKQELFTPIQMRILSGLGLVDIVQGAASTRRESTLNPKPFISEIEQGIKDFKALLNDIIQVIIEKNNSKHRKWMNAEIKIQSTPVKAFMNDKFRQILRSLYDRGSISKRTLTEVCGEMDYDLEVLRREEEKKEGHEKKMYPPVTQNIEKDVEPKKDDVPGDKKGIEKKNFNNSKLVVIKGCKCFACDAEFDLDITPETGDTINCPDCEEVLEVAKIIGEPRDPRRTEKKSKHLKGGSKVQNKISLLVEKAIDEEKEKINV